MGIGVRLRLRVTDADGLRSIFKWVNTGSSFGSNPLRQELGVGNATRIDALEVFWPTTGETQHFENIDVDQAIEITEGSRSFRRLPLTSVRFDGITSLH